MTVGERIKKRREECGISVIDLAMELGKARSTIYRYESDEVQDMPITVLGPLAEALHTTPAYLMGWTDDPEDYETDDLSDVRAELIEYFDGDAKKIRAFLKAEAEDHEREALEQSMNDRDVFSYKNILPVQPFRVPLLGSVAAGEPIYAPEDFDVSIPVGAPVRCDYALRVKGDSMKPTYLDGDIVLVRQQQTFDDGRIAIVAVGDEATLKHVYRTRNGVTLVSDNPDYPPMPFVEDECDQIRIMGKPVAYLRGV